MLERWLIRSLGRFFLGFHVLLFCPKQILTFVFLVLTGKKADREHRATMLFSSNIANMKFYNSHGFFEIAHVEVGRDNPMWKEAPVIVPLVCRFLNRSEANVGTEG